MGKKTDKVPTTIFGNPRKVPINVEYNINQHRKTGCPCTSGWYSPLTGRGNCDNCGGRI